MHELWVFRTHIPLFSQCYRKERETNISNNENSMLKYSSKRTLRDFQQHDRSSLFFRQIVCTRLYLILFKTLSMQLPLQAVTIKKMNTKMCGQIFVLVIDVGKLNFFCLYLRLLFKDTRFLRIFFLAIFEF